MLKKTVKSTAAPFMTYPAAPSLNGPGGIYLRPVIIFGAMARVYDVLLRMTKEPARSANAVLLPRVMAPRPVVRMPVRTVASMGQLRRSLTSEKKLAKGVALSRERAHQVRPT